MQAFQPRLSGNHRAGPQTGAYTMHQLRHAAIDQIQRGTGDIEIARMLARHENISVTQDYLHSTIDDLRAAIERMGESV